MTQSFSTSPTYSIDEQQILYSFAEQISSVIKGAKIYIFILDGNQRPVLRWGLESKAVALQGIGPNGYPVIQECLAEQIPLVRQYSRQKSGRGVKSGGGAIFSTTVAVPIVFRRTALGVIFLGFNDRKRAITPRDIRFCQAVAFAMAIALRTVKNYEEIQTDAKERQIMANQLAEANRLKSEYLTNTSHEFRTPIATIMGYAHLLTDGICGPLNEQQKQTLGRLADNARGLLKLVDQILDYSRLEKGRTGLFSERQQLAPLLDQIQEELAPFEAGRPYRVRFEVQEDLPPIDTDWGKLKNVIMNILQNAIKFTDQGEVKLCIKQGSKEEVSFLISDTGVGIPRDQIPLIFERFRQLDGSIRRRHPGAGLGLTIAKNLVDLMGGRIEVESELGKGSSFTLIIPVKND